MYSHKAEQIHHKTKRTVKLGRWCRRETNMFSSSADPDKSIWNSFRKKVDKRSVVLVNLIELALRQNSSATFFQNYQRYCCFYRQYLMVRLVYVLSVLRPTSLQLTISIYYPNCRHLTSETDATCDAGILDAGMVCFRYHVMLLMRVFVVMKFSI